MFLPDHGHRLDGASLLGNAAVPQLSVAPGRRATAARGLLRLDFRAEAATGRPTLALVAQRAPLKALRSFPHGARGALVHLHNVSGGVLSGDVLTTEIDVRSGVHALVTTTSANRIYKARVGDPPGLQTLTARIAAGGRLEVLPDPTILFRDSFYEQKTVYELEGDAGLLAWDVVAAGRLEYEAPFSFTRFASETAVYWNGAPVSIDRIDLTPGARAPQALARLAGRTHCGGLLFLDGRLSAADWQELEGAVQELLATVPGRPVPTRFLAGASTLHRQGLGVRLAADTAGAPLAALAAVRELLLARVWGEATPLPRKIY